MKVAPVSADLLVKLALAGAAVGALVWLASKAAGALPSLPAVPDAINPASSNNVINRGVSAVVTAATGQDNSLGTWWRGVVSDDDARVKAMLEGRSGGATGSW